MSSQNPAREAEITRGREIPPHIICPSYREEVNGNYKIFTDDPAIGITGRIFHFDVPLAPVKLTPRSHDILNKLKPRGATYINLLCAEYVAFRYERFKGKNRDVGVLLQLPRNRAKKALDMVKDKDGEAKAKKMQNEHLKALVIRLRGKEEQYLEAVRASWLHHDHGNFEYKVQYYKDLGVLMQLESEQSREILRVLLEMVLEMKIVKRKDWDNFGVEFVWRIIYDVEAPVEAVGPHVEYMPAQPRLETNKKRKTPSDDDHEERQPRPKKATRGGYVPSAGEWKCSKCDWWSNLEFCNRKDRHGQSVCIGRRSGT
jgi:hypothetical protein